MRTLVTSVAVLLLACSSAAAAADQDPVHFWSVSRVEQGAGAVQVASGAQLGGKLEQHVDVGRTVFNLPLHAPYWYDLPRDRAFGAMSASADGKHYSVLAQAPPPNPVHVGAAKGAIAHLDEYQAYVKRDDDASLRITISDLLLQAVDDNNDLAAWECPRVTSCEPVRTVIRFHARAYAASAGGDFFDEGGVAYLEGHQHSWRPGATTSADSASPLWGETTFDVNGDADDSGTGAAAVMYLNAPRTLTVPLGVVRPGELFAVHVSLEAEAVDDRGGESAAQAFVQDPQKRGKPLLLTTRGLVPRGKPRFKEPAVRTLQPARCPGGAPHNAGVVQLSDASFAANESESSPMVLVTRTGGSHGSVSVRSPRRAAAPWPGATSARRAPRCASPTATPRRGWSRSRCARIARSSRPRRSPSSSPTPPAGGSARGIARPSRSSTTTRVRRRLAPAADVHGRRSGRRAQRLRARADRPRRLPFRSRRTGAFAFPGTHPAGDSYEIQVSTQPHAPDQVCTVEHGAGTFSIADVRDVAVHCVTPPVPTGLDPTFGSGGRVSTPLGSDAHGEAVVIQPSGGIVTAGWRTDATGTDFALTRHDAAGNLDHGFGTGGIVTTDIGGRDDEAFDAALTPDGGIVAVGRTDAAGVANQDFGIARYRADGTADAGFGSGGIVRTTSRAAVTRPTPSPSSPTARSSSPATPPRASSTATWRSSATTRTGRATRRSGAAGWS